MEPVSSCMLLHGMNIRSDIFIGTRACQHSSSLVVESPGTSEIGQDNAAASGSPCHQNVFGFEVPMDNGLLVEKFKGNKYLSYNDRSLDVEQFAILELDV